MAELLCRATAHWLDKLTKEEVDKMSVEQKQSYEARSQIGDIIVVRPDGWKWGKCECPPEYKVVKVPDMSEAEAKIYEQPLMETYTDKDGKEQSRMLRIRKHSLTDTSVLTSVALKSKIVVKTGLATEVVQPKIAEK
jgi:hypothetical protein